MADPTPILSRRFSDEEVARILTRASMLQHGELPDESTDGMSLGELEQVAAEAGIDPSLVRRAASALIAERGGPTVPIRGATGPKTLRFECVTDGEVSVDSYEPVVRELETTLKCDGVASTTGRSLRWTHKAPQPGTGAAFTMPSISFVMLQERGQITMRIEEELRRPMMAWSFIVAVICLSIPLMAVLRRDLDFAFSNAVGGLSAAVGLGAFLVSQHAQRRMIRARRDELQALMGRLLSLAAPTGTPARVSPPPVADAH